MADPRLFDAPVEVAQQDAFDTLAGILAGIPEAQVPFSEKYGNPYLPGSPATLLQAVASDHQVREVHGQGVLLVALAHALAAQQKRIEALAKAAKAGAKR